jgi:hypothetical protein
LPCLEHLPVFVLYAIQLYIAGEFSVKVMYYGFET